MKPEDGAACAEATDLRDLHRFFSLGLLINGPRCSETLCRARGNSSDVKKNSAHAPPYCVEPVPMGRDLPVISGILAHVITYACTSRATATFPAWLHSLGSGERGQRMALSQSLAIFIDGGDITTSSSSSFPSSNPSVTEFFRCVTSPTTSCCMTALLRNSQCGISSGALLFVLP